MVNARRQFNTRSTRTNEGPTTQVSRQVYEALVERAVDMKIQPALAKSWKTTDPNTWVFTLRDDVKFSD